MTSSFHGPVAVARGRSIEHVSSLSESDHVTQLTLCRGALGEGNEAEVKAERQRLSAEMDSLTSYMDELWKLRRGYDERGEVPTGEQLKALKPGGATAKGQEHDAQGADGSLSELPTERLRVRRRSIVTQLTRKRNLLRYQQPTACGVENVMPDCPLRVKTERQIASLTEELTRVEYELARRG